MSNQKSNKEMYKLTQFYRALYEKYLDYEYQLEIIKKEGDVNFRLPHSKCLENKRPELIGNTLLHLAVDSKVEHIFDDLLSRGADFTIKNNQGFDVLQLAVNKCDKRYDAPYNFEGALKDPFIDKLLDLHMNSGNFDNPSDPNGITYFHAACLTNNVEAVQFFLKNGASVNQLVNENSSLLAGYTPLHIAAKCSNVETVELLLTHGGDISLKNSEGMTPLHILLKENLNIIDSYKYKGEWETKRPITDLERNERIMDLILNNCPDISQSTGLNTLHIFCTMRDTRIFQNYLKNNNNININCQVEENSSLWIGYTPLHFTMLFHINNVDFLIDKGADLMAKDTQGVTPFDICLELYDMQDVHLILNHSIWNDLILTDGKTKLLDFIKAMQELKKFKSFLTDENVNAQIPIDSSLWPGCTILHVILEFYVKRKNLDSRRQLYHHLMTECLIRGADISIENANGDTPVDLAIRLDKVHMIHLLFQHRSITENFTTKSGLSYLHIACAIASRALVNTLLKKVTDVNQLTKSSCCVGLESISAVSTPLHIAVSIGNVAIVKMLLKQGADVQAKDCNNMTPIHCILMSSESTEMAKVLLTKVVKDNVSDGGLSYLHVASLTNNVKTVKKLLNAGVDIDAVVTYEADKNNKDTMKFLSRFSGYTALHIAMELKKLDVVKLLVQNGADIFKSYKSSELHSGKIIFPLYHVLDMTYHWSNEVRDDFSSRLLQDESIQERSAREIGLTMLHVYCYQRNVDSVKQYLDDGNDVNAQIHWDSPVWAGCTPLHVLLKLADPNNYYEEQLQADVGVLLKLLLDNEADPAIPNAEGDTALHIADRTLRSFWRDNQNPINIRQYRVNILLDHLKDFTTSHSNNEGVSYFHIACNVNHLNSVELFSKQQVDVNQVTDYFSDELPGYSPLHLAINSSSKRSFGILNQLKIIDLLLDYEADVNAEDSLGETSLHKAATSEPPREALFEILVRHGADVQVRDILGRTAFEILLKSKTATTQEIQFFLSHGLSANTINPISNEGYLAMTLYKNPGGTAKTSDFETMIGSINVAEANDHGRTAIHNVVSCRVGTIDKNDYSDVIEKLKSLGCNVDYQDNSGDTALHTAVRFRNWKASLGLFNAGADINIVNFSGKSAFDILFYPSPMVKNEQIYDDTKFKTTAALISHIHKLQRCKLNVSRENELALEKALRDDYYGYWIMKLDDRLDVEIQRTKSAKIESSSLVLYDFLSETGAVAAFSSMPQWKRQTITDFFENTHRYKLHNEFVETAGLLKLQYRKALARLSLIEPAKVALQSLLEFWLPDLCSDAVLRFLTNSELKIMIDATHS